MRVGRSWEATGWGRTERGHRGGCGRPTATGAAVVSAMEHLCSHRWDVRSAALGMEGGKMGGRKIGREEKREEEGKGEGWEEGRKRGRKKRK